MQSDSSTHTTASMTAARERLLVLVAGPFPGRTRAGAHRILAAARGADVLVVAPALPLPGERWLIDQGAREARARANLESWIDALADSAESLRGEVGDENPALAVADAVAGFPPDEVLTSLIADVARAPARSGPLERLGEFFAPPPAAPGTRISHA